MDTQAVLRAFNEIAEAQGWAFHHTPRNLATAISTEAAELLLEFQWQMEQQALTSDQQQRVAAEMADVLMYLIKLADVMDIDLQQAVNDKIAHNRQRFLSD